MKLGFYLIVRGLLGVVIIIPILYVFTGGFSYNLDEYLAEMRPDSLNDWIFLIGTLSGAFITGALNGLLKAPKSLILLGIVLYPAHAFGVWLLCGLGNDISCKTTLATFYFVMYLVLVFMVPTILWRGYQRIHKANSQPGLGKSKDVQTDSNSEI